MTPSPRPTTDPDPLSNPEARRVAFRDPFAELDGHMRAFDQIQKALEPYMRSRDEDARRYADNGVAFDWKALTACKQKTVVLAKLCCECALGEHVAFAEAYASMHEDGKAARKVSVLFNRGFNFLQRAFEFSFRVFGYVGGFDAATEAIFEKVHAHLVAMEKIKHQRQSEDTKPKGDQEGSSQSPVSGKAPPQAVSLSLDQAVSEEPVPSPVRPLAAPEDHSH